jgi:hypothetical protein
MIQKPIKVIEFQIICKINTQCYIPIYTENTNIFLIFFLVVGGVVAGIPLFTAGTKRANVFLFIPFLEEVHHSAE